jgi:hypothetical protein
MQNSCSRSERAARRLLLSHGDAGVQVVSDETPPAEDLGERVNVRRPDDRIADRARAPARG